MGETFSICGQDVRTLQGSACHAVLAVDEELIELIECSGNQVPSGSITLDDIREYLANHGRVAIRNLFDIEDRGCINFKAAPFLAPKVFSDSALLYYQRVISSQRDRCVDFEDQVFFFGSPDQTPADIGFTWVVDKNPNTASEDGPFYLPSITIPTSSTSGGQNYVISPSRFGSDRARDCFLVIVWAQIEKQKYRLLTFSNQGEVVSVTVDVAGGDIMIQENNGTLITVPYQPPAQVEVALSGGGQPE